MPRSGRGRGGRRRRGRRRGAGPGRVHNGQDGPLPLGRLDADRVGHVAGAEALAIELATVRDLPGLAYSTEIAQLSQCDAMLVYLTGQTWSPPYAFMLRTCQRLKVT